MSYRGERKRLLIVGGVAGGASCAARARRQSEEAEIVIFERGPYVSFANCGLPYYVGDVINVEKNLFLATPELFRDRFGIEVRTRHEVVAVHAAEQEIEVRDMETGKVGRERYDALVLAPGAAPAHPPLPGIDLPGIFSVRTVPDSRVIREWIEGRKVRSAVVVGAGYVGLEMAENLTARGIATTVIEMEKQVLPTFDPEMVVKVKEQLIENGVTLDLGDAVSSFGLNPDSSLTVTTEGGHSFKADMVVLGIGVKPETALAKTAGIEIGEYGGIRVDERMQTSDSHIWAVGDAVEVRDRITGEYELVPLAGPANRQGRLAGDVIMGKEATFKGVFGTAICGVFGLQAAESGLTEKKLKKLAAAGKGIDYEKVYLHPNDHVTYYPGASQFALKLLYRKSDGKVLGVQAAGPQGIDKRVDVISMAMQMGATVYDLEEAELCYAPQFGAAKDPVNFAGMVAANSLRGNAPVVRWDDVESTEAVVLDARTHFEYETEHVPGAVNIPVDELRGRLSELPQGREVWVYCRVGQRSYYATRILRMNGYDARNLSGGFLSFEAFTGAGLLKNKAV